MQFDARGLLDDVDQAARDIKRYLEGLDVDDYLDDDKTQASVERKFEIIGEALNRLHAVDPELASRIPKLRRIVDFRNVLSHNYDQVQQKRVWTYSQSNLPELQLVVQKLLAELGRREE